MCIDLPLAAATAPRVTAWDGLELAALALLAVSSLLLWRKVTRPDRRERDEGLPLVVAAAAVATVIDEPHRIVGVAELASPEPSAPSLWSLEGRRQLFASHRLR